MVLKIEQILGSKNSIQILRLLTLRPYLSYGLTQLSNELDISKSNILRIISILLEDRLVIELNTRRKKTYRINSSHKLSKKLYEIFMIERQSKIEPKLKNIIDLVFSQIGEKAELFILFGSSAYGLQKKGSDIDICVIGDKKIEGLNFDYPPNKIELHNYSWSDFKSIADFVVLECLLNGIVYKGEIFDILSKIESVPKPYMIYRFNKAKQFLKKAEKLEENAKNYFSDIAKIILGEISSILNKKTTLPKRKINIKDTLNLINNIEKRLADEGDKIWIV